LQKAFRVKEKQLQRISTHYFANAHFLGAQCDQQRRDAEDTEARNQDGNDQAYLKDIF
jgi:predicted alpha-1,6-mannanase (GH76 family)